MTVSKKAAASTLVCVAIALLLSCFAGKQMGVKGRHVPCRGSWGTASPKIIEFFAGPASPHH